MFASGEISESSMQQQMKHSSRLMPIYYGQNHTRLALNREVEALVVAAMYEAQANILREVASGDRFVAPQSNDRKEALSANVLSAKDVKALISMSRSGAVSFREHRLGGCMKSGACEYGGIESVARCAGGDGSKPCVDVLFDRSKEHLVRMDLKRLICEVQLLTPGHPRHNALLMECRAMENYLDAINTI